MVGTPWLRQVAPHLSRYTVFAMWPRFVLVPVALALLSFVSWCIGIWSYLAQSLFSWRPEIHFSTLICMALAPAVLICQSFLISRFRDIANYIVLAICGAACAVFAVIPFLEVLNPDQLLGRSVYTPFWFRCILAFMFLGPLLALTYVVSYVYTSCGGKWLRRN
jgi:hypothetical protein